MRCVFADCANDTQWTYGTSAVCTDHARMLRSASPELKGAIFDACTRALETSMLATRQTLSDADKSRRAVEREARAERELERRISTRK